MPWSEIWMKPSGKSSCWHSIIELEALCKKLKEDTQRLDEENGTLEGMVESHNELVMEIARETGLDRMGEDNEDEE
jgi:hypothetical protein